MISALLRAAVWFLTVAALPSTVFAQGGVSDEEVDAAALKELEGFLNDSKARGEHAAKNPNAAQVESFFGKFPEYAQKELNAIVMEIMKESKAGATKHSDAYKKGGAQGAMDSFSPAVKKRIKALEDRLKADKSFNSPQNLEQMKSFFPAFLGGAGAG